MARTDQVELDGVRPVRYDGDAQVDRFVYALDNVLEYLGEGRQYARLMGMSGRAFRLIWYDRAYYRDRNDDGDESQTPMEFGDLASVRTAMVVTGYGFQILGNGEREELSSPPVLDTSVTPAELREAAVSSLGDRSRPVLALMELESKLGWRILTGYEQNGKKVIGWCGQEDRESSTEGIAFRPDSGFTATDWEQSTAVLIALTGGKDAAFGDRERDMCKEALERVIACWEPGREGTMASGQAAYDAWLAAIEADDGDASDKEMVNRLVFHAMVLAGDLASNRHHACTFLNAMEEKGWNAYALHYAAGNCAAIHNLVWDCWKIAGGFWVPPDAGVPRFRDRENRRQIAEIIREMKRLDGDTVKQMQVALDGWDTTPRDFMKER